MSNTENTASLWLSTMELTTVAILTTLAAVNAWYFADFDGVQAVTNAGIASLVTAVSVVAGLYLLKWVDPFWYSS
jgi:hypothetical protein